MPCILVFYLTCEVSTPSLSVSVQAGVVKVHVSVGPSSRVYTSCLDGVVRLWDILSGDCVQRWEGHSSQLLDMAVGK